MADASVLVSTEKGHADFSDKAVLEMSPCEWCDIGDGQGKDTRVTASSENEHQQADIM